MQGQQQGKNGLKLTSTIAVKKTDLILKEKREGPISDLEMEKPSNPSNFSLCRVFLQHLLDDPTGGYSPLNNVFTNKDCPCKMHSQFDRKKSLNVLYHNR